MEEPFFVLLKNISCLFHSEPIRNGKYIYPAVQNLKDALDQYNADLESSFSLLLKAISESMPHIEKWRLDFSSIKKSLENLASNHNLPQIEWDPILSHPKLSLAFQLNALNRTSIIGEPLDVWLTKKLKKSFQLMNSAEQLNALVLNMNYPEFNYKLKEYQKEHPDFLFDLMMHREKNFIKICSTRLILHLTDLQIAQAILKHLGFFITPNESQFLQVKQLIHTLNGILSNGLSISTLLRNSQAKSLLMNSVHFQIYQSEEYKKHHFHLMPVAALNSEYLKF